MKLKLSKIVEIDDVSTVIENNLRTVFNNSIEFYFNSILNDLEQKKLSDCANSIHELRTLLNDMDIVLDNEYQNLINYQKILIMMQEKELDETPQESQE